MFARSAHWWIAGLSIAAYCALLWAFAVNIPIDDDYEEIFRRIYIEVDQAESFGNRVSLLVSQHGEHRLLFSRLVYLAERFAAGGTDIRRLIFIGNLSWLVLFGLLLSTCRGSPRFPVAVSLFSLLLFQPAAHESMFWAMVSLENHWVMVFALASFILVARHRYIAGAFFACLSLYTQGNGIVAVLIAMAWMAFHLFRERGSKRGAAVGIGACAAVIGLYFHGYVRPVTHPPLWEALFQPVDAGLFFLGIAGASVAFAGATAAVVAGGVLVCSFVYVTYRRLFLAQPVLYAFLLFLVGSAAALALGRYWFGVASIPEQSRYGVTANGLTACIAVALVSLGGATARGWTAVRVGAVGLALAYAVASYAVNLSAIKQRHDRLLEGAAVFAAHGITAGLVSFGPIGAGQMMRYAIDHGHYRLPPLPAGVPVEKFYDPGVRLRPYTIPAAVSQFPEFSARRLIARIDGTVRVSAEADSIHLRGRTDAPEEDPEVAIYVLLPTLPASVASREVEDEAGGFEIMMTFPPQVDTAAVARDMCVAYISTSRPLTLFRGNLPICEARIVSQPNP